MSKNNILPADIKKKIVRLYLAEGWTAECLEKEYGISKSSVKRWAREFRQMAKEDPAIKEELEIYKEIRRLLKEKAELEKENTFLIKAAEFFAE